MKGLTSFVTRSRRQQLAVYLGSYCDRMRELMCLNKFWAVRPPIRVGRSHMDSLTLIVVDLNPTVLLPNFNLPKSENAQIHV